MSSQIGLIGLAVMGANLARNIANNGHTISVYNRTYTKTQELLEIWNENKGSGELLPFEEIKDFVASLERPRKVILMVKSGQPVDDFIAQLLPFLEAEDIILDCGNSNWHDTVRRQEMLSQKGIEFVGCGVSGGEEGALNGPSIMPGGSVKAVNSVLPILESIAAKDFAGKACVTNVGLGGSGHFVKMVHNAIEYVIMQAIAEMYDILKRSNGLGNEQIAEIFENINTGKSISGEEYMLNNTGLQSYLLDITTKILRTKDNLAEGDLIDQIGDQAKAKGTGAWAVESSFELGVYTPSFADALYARIGSARSHHFKYNNEASQPILPFESDEFDAEVEAEFSIQESFDDNEEMDNVVSDLDLIFGDILFAVHAAGFLQGLDLIAQANKDFDWNIDMNEVWRIWQGGCIIRTSVLTQIGSIAQGGQPYGDIEEFITSFYPLRGLILDVPTPVLDSVYSYLQTLYSAKLPTNLIQAQRDFFGAHTYQRNDREGVFTGGWEKTS